MIDYLYIVGWFQGLSEKFLSCDCPKMLLLAGILIKEIYLHLTLEGANYKLIYSISYMLQD